MNYYSFNTYLKDRYGEKVRRLSLNAGFSCPNKSPDGEGGCIFCNEFGFNQFPDTELSLDEQIKFLMARSKEKYGTAKFIAYFQSSTNTNAGILELEKAYNVIKKYPEVVALYIATRPDCIDEEKL
ncbi:MAG: TIGR01212 family radical SAM protein, partial [Candidatus Omnitrophica bacterium]|nr:TIGR01212 family radical SAM protein [Candidatus Omnitrophota bacterium]